MGQSDTLTEPTLRTLTGSDLLHMCHCMRGLPYEYDEALTELRRIGVHDVFMWAIERQLMSRRALAGFFYLNL